MVKCAVKSCDSHSEKHHKSDGITFHMIPKDFRRKEKWIKAIRLLRRETDWWPSPKTVICSKHFNDQHKIQPTHDKGNVRLSKSAVPIIIDEPDQVIKPGSSAEMEIDFNIDTDEEMLEILDTPRKHKMRKTINRLKLVARRRLSCIKKLRQKTQRLKNKNKKLSDMVKKMKEERHLTEEEEMQLNANDEMCTLMIQFQQSFHKKRSFKKFPLALKKFALSLNFYSPAAYKYIRSSFNNCLPHPRTLLNWYNKINGDPGFTDEAFKALKIKSDNYKSAVICNLVIDEMAIRQQKIFDGKKHHGYVDYGLSENNECQNLASSALVLLLVCLNETWKLPIGYFFTRGLTASKLKIIIDIALEKCNKVNINVVSVTCDGSQTNIAAMRMLGCKLDDPKALQPSFPHPATGSQVVLMLDACHMLKLVRNSFEAKKVFFDKEGKEINWKFVKHLQEIQDAEGLRTGNKLTRRHIDFRQQIMKVKLASQLLSNSTAQSLRLCKDLLPEFSESEATAKFIKMFNDVFDVLNTRGDRKSYGFKKPLNNRNKEEIFKLLEEYKDYVTNLKVKVITKKTIKRKDKIPLIHINTATKLILDCKFKTGFLGLLVCLESIKILYTKLVETSLMKYIATYRLSQDHLEIFFGCIRQKGGYNNNPNVIQFKSAYKKTLNHLELKTTFHGNCVPLEKINILNCTSANPIQKINMSSIGHRADAEEDHEIIADYKGECEVQQNTNVIYDLITDISKQIVGYISGYVVTKLGKELKCEFCITALLSTEVLPFHKLIMVKDKGGLCYPSQHVYEICICCEAIIRQSISMSGKINSLHPKYKPTYLATRTLEKLQGNNNNIIRELAIHPFNVSSLQADHSLLLINAILQKYINIRLYHESKLHTLINKKDNKRQLYNKLTLHSGV